MDATRARDENGLLLQWAALPLALLLGFWTVTLARAADPWCFLDYVNLAFHEAGHVLFSPLGHTIHYLGGTLGQLIAPALLCAYFLIRERRALSAAFCFWWLGQNFINIARYMADARDLALPLVGGGDHDWNELFYNFGLLAEPRVVAVSTATHHLGVILMIAGLAWVACFALPRQKREAVAAALEIHHPALRLLLG